jgi:hypothetical protein
METSVLFLEPGCDTRVYFDPSFLEVPEHMLLVYLQEFG